LPQESFFGSGLPNYNFKQEIFLLEKNLDMLVIEEQNSSLVKEIDALDQFERVYSGDGYIWINRRGNAYGCRF